uniref:WIBG Mago-binding domain-containing protein n=1 Tax=Tetradesmus obliquus TaxID=3088 RepID=A0A383VQF8_TETOB
MEQYVINENGEKVLAGSRRPDGTIRKERRIRAGYTPQDEQPTYQSTGAMWKQGVPKCPGLDSSAAAAASASAKSKAAKKNEKRKAKKADGPAGGDDAAAPSSSTQAAAPKPAAAATAASSSAASSTAAAAPAAAAAAPAAAAAAEGPAAVLDRQIKALSKKVRQCQALNTRAAAGEALSAQEQEKLGKMPGWQEEIKDLEHQLAKMLV